MGKIGVIIKDPGRVPRHVNISNTLENLQKTVGGYIETVTLCSDLVVICDEEGHIKGEPHCCNICSVGYCGTVMLPKFRNVGEDGKKHAVFNWFEWKRDSQKEYPKIHPTQKPVSVLKRLIEIFTDPGDVVIDPCAGSGTTLRAAAELGRNVYGFEVSTKFYNDAKEKMLGGYLTKCN